MPVTVDLGTARPRTPAAPPLAPPSTEPTPQPASTRDANGLSEYERHKIARGYTRAPAVPAGDRSAKPAQAAGTQTQTQTEPTPDDDPEARAKAEEDAEVQAQAAKGTPTPGDQPQPDQQAQSDQQTQPSPSDHTWEDPDTHEVFDLRVRKNKRIKSLLEERWRLKQRNEALLGELAGLRTQIPGAAGPAQLPVVANSIPGQSQPQPQPGQPTGSPQDAPPQLDQFQTYDEYAAARTAWIVRQELQKYQQTQTQQQERTTQLSAAQQQLASWNEGLPTARQSYPDFDSVIARIPLTPATQHIVRAVMSSPVKYHFAYYLGAHPDVMQALTSQPTLDAHLRLLGKIEAQVEAAHPPTPATEPGAPAGSAALPGTPTGAQTAPVSRAPQPTAPVLPGRAAASASADASPLDYQRYRQSRGMPPTPRY